MGINYSICPNCPDGNGKYKRIRHVEIFNTEASAACGDTSSTECGMISDRTHDGTIKWYKIQKKL